MAINPLTGREEDEEKVILPSVPGATQSEVNPTGIGSLFKPQANQPQIAQEGTIEQKEGIVGPTPEETEIKPTVATFESPIVDKEKRLVNNKDTEERTTPLTPTEEIQRDIRGLETRGDLDVRKVERQKKQAISDAETTYRQNLDLAVGRINEQGQRVMDTTQRLNSLRGAGRGTKNEAAITEQQTQINGLIGTAQRNADLQLQMQKMQIEGAESDAISSIRDKIKKSKEELNTQLVVAQENQLALNNALGANFSQSMDGMLGILETAGEDVSGIDKAKSADLGYFVTEDGGIYMNNAGNPVQFKAGVETGKFTPLEIDSFAQGISAGKLKFTDLKLDSRDIAKVIGAMNNKLDSEPGLSVNSLKAQRIIKDLGLTSDDESVRTVTNLLKVNSEEEVRNMIATDEFKNASFVAGNQKLFDDLRNDASSFKDIDRSFNGMNDVFNQFSANPEGNRAAMEQALIIMFNKMLDPGSVVREGEFDRTSQGQSVIAAGTGYLDRLVKGGAGITTETLKEMVGVAGTLHEAALNTVDDLKGSYKGFAGDLGADPEFVDRFFEKGFGDEIEFDTEEEDEIKAGFGGGTTGGTFESSSGTSFEIPEDTGLTSPDKTGGTNEVGFKIQSDIDRVAGGSNVNSKDILAIANNRSINPAILAAFLRNDSTYGSKGLGAKNNNPGNVGQFDRLGTDAVEGFSTIQEGIDAAAANLEKRTLAFKSIYNREPTAFELAKGISNEGKKFFGPYMTEEKGADRVQQIVNQLTS